MTMPLTVLEPGPSEGGSDFGQLQPPVGGKDGNDKEPRGTLVELWRSVCSGIVQTTGDEVR